MAATDQHYRNQRILDIVFGVSSALMLLATGWMFWQDYNREFKSVQRTFRDVESGLAEREMIDRMPDADLVKEKRNVLRRARQELAKVQDYQIDTDALRVLPDPDGKFSSSSEKIDPSGKKIESSITAPQALSVWDKQLSATHDKADEKYRTIKADYDAKTSYYNIAVDDAAVYPPDSARRKALDADVAARKKELDAIQQQLQSAKDALDAIDTEYRNKVRDWLVGPEKAVADAEDQEKKVTGLFDRYAKLSTQKGWNFGDEFRALPILDAFESPTKIRQIWLPDLTIDYSFKEVPRYDRCTSCHLGIDRAAFEKTSLAKLSDDQENQRLRGKLIKAQEMLEKRKDAGENLGFDPADLPGEKHAHLGLITLLLVFSSLVAGGSIGLLERSTRVGLRVLVGGLTLTLLTSGAIAYFAPRSPTVKTVKLNEGQITQYAGHPRLDLFVDSNSPHSMEKFGCTICHAGQGSATSFTLASHTPNDEHEEQKWKELHDWESIHHWDFPMLSKRFVESSCVKCHHQMTDLIRNGVKEEAPKLLRGFNLVKENGCFGCHEIAGQKSGRPVGPDLRLEPAPALEYLSAADQERAQSDPFNPPGQMRKVGPSLRRIAEKTNEEWTRSWIQSPRGFRPDTKMPHFYGQSTNSAEALATTAPEQKTFPATEMYGIAHYLMVESKAHLEGKDAYREALLKGKENLHALQAALTKTGLSDKDAKELLDVSRRFVDLALLSSPLKAKAINADALRQRQLQERIIDLNKRLAELTGKGAAEADLKPTLDERAVAGKELVSVTDSLVGLAKPTPISQEILGEDGAVVSFPPKDGNADNGRRLFTEKGCLACHAHQATTQPGGLVVAGSANFGPELSRIAAKLTPELGKENARRWLVQWLLNPNVYHPRTRMPITHLKVEDANDVATWLLTRPQSARDDLKKLEAKLAASKGDDRKPIEEEIAGLKSYLADLSYTNNGPSKPDLHNIKALARVYLGKAPGITHTDLDAFLPAEGNPTLDSLGIPKERLDDPRLARDAEERKLEKGKVTENVLLWYIGKKAIGRQGCYGCHDIPGFETAKPIGVALNDWGKKDPERLAFEDADTYARTHFNIVPTRMTSRDVEDRIKKLEASPDKEKHSQEIAKLNEMLGAQQRIYELEAKADTTAGLTSKERAELEVIRPLKLFARDKDKQPVEEIFFKALEHPHQSREGFLHEKLLDPRSYDFNRERAWDDRLRMPQFKFARSRRNPGETDAQYQARQDKDEAEAREAVMTFILGLVADPVPLQYVSQPKGDQKSVVLGRQVLDKYNCAGCHQVQPGVYQFKADENNLKAVFQAYQLTAGDNDANFKEDFFFQGHSAWFGAPPTSALMAAHGYFDASETAKAEDNGLTGIDIIRLTDALRFTGSDKVARDLPAGSNLFLPRGSYSTTLPFGGTFTDLMVPYLMRKNTTLFPKDDPGKSRAVLPPPLVREGERVQPDWLYKFLLNPGPIRPESYMLLRMPKFNMSPEESRALVNYFAAFSRQTNPGAGVTYPYVSIDQRDEEYWKRMNGRYRSKLDAKQLEARVKEMKPLWEAQTKKELADAEASLVELKKAEADAKAKKDDNDLANRKKAVEASEKRITALKADLAKGAFADQEKRWKSSEIYARDAFKLLTNKDLCMKCHNIGASQIEGPQGPNLALSAERLRPDWTSEWIAHPKRLFTYAPVMPQNFPNEPDPLKWKWQDTFVGKPLDQITAVRDILMDQPRLTDLLAKPLPPTPPPAASGGKK